METLGAYGAVTGVDCADDAIEYCRQRGLASVSKLDLNDWNPVAGSYDIVVSLDVMCCREITSDVLFCQKAYDALGMNGLLILNVPAFECLRRTHDSAVHIGRRYRLQPLRALLQECGFAIEIATYRLPFLFFVMLCVRYGEKLRPNRTIKSDLRPLPGILNRCLLSIHECENALVTHGIRLPIGSSVFIVARKPA